MSKVLVEVKEYKDLYDLKEYSKHIRQKDIEYYMDVVYKDFKDGNRDNKNVFCLFTNDGYFEDVSTFHIFKGIYDVVEIKKDMFNV